MRLTPRHYAEAYLVLAEQVHAKQLPELARRFWELVARERKFAWRKRIMLEAEELHLLRAGGTKASVQTAREPSPDVKRLIEHGLEKSLGKAVQIEYAVKPHLLSGAVIEVGDRRYDGSLKGRLDALERALAGEHHL